MRVERIDAYTITVWAEQLPTGWTGLASIHPSIPNTWVGGPKHDSLIADGVEPTEQAAEEAALRQAVDALRGHLRHSDRPA